VSGTARTVFLAGGKLTLAEALTVAPGEIVALTGAGGKTTALARLAEELVAQGGRVLVTTTTHIFPPSGKCSDCIVEECLATLLAAASTALERNPLVVVARGVDADGKLVGIEPAWVEELRARLPITHLLVEADGSRGRPFKAPAEHEPVIPPATDLVVPVVGLSAIGHPISSGLVHRPEQVARLAEAQLGDTISPAVVAKVLWHPEGSAKGAPSGARIVPLLNQTDDDKRREAGRQVARLLLRQGAGRIVLAALRAPAPVIEVAIAAPAAGVAKPGPAVSAIVLAAGQGRRMGALKLALPLGPKSVLRHVVDAALASPVGEVVVVLGHGAAELGAELPKHSRLRSVYNPDFVQGQSSSLKAGINALNPKAEGVVFLLGDQPLVTPETIDALVATFQNYPAAIVQPLYRGIPGNPVLFARALFPELLQVTGDRGGRELLDTHRTELAAVDLDSEAPDDIDTGEDYGKIADKFR
jgi:molybdenum cofactor cytidylyltransferase